MSKRIKWGAGFFRLWVLVSLIWILLVGAISWSEIHKPFVEPYVFIEFEGDVAWKYFSDKALEARRLVNSGFFVEAEVVSAPGITYIGRGGENMAETMKQKAPLMVGFYEAQVSERRASAIRAAVGFGIAPPLALLITGALIAWALRGFRDDRTDSTG